MGLFDRFFRTKEDVSMASVKDEKKEIDTEKEKQILLNILNCLGILNPNEIKKKLELKNMDYDESIISRLMLNTNNIDISRLLNYYQVVNLGYGKIKLNEIKERLDDTSKKMIAEGKNKLEIVEELIETVKHYIEEYKRILTSLNETIIRLEKSIENEIDLIVMMDYWFNTFKEEKLGYPIDLSNKIETMSRELKYLPYGGYSDEEISKFKSKAMDMAEEGSKEHEPVNYTCGKIKNSILEPMKKRYTADVGILKKKIQMIEESKTLDDNGKKKNVQNAIDEFKKIYGHKTNHEEVKTSGLNDNAMFLIETNIQKLMTLSGGGYGPVAIFNYRQDCDKILESDLAEFDKYIEINKTANKYIDLYESNKKTYNNWKKNQLETLSGDEYRKKEKELDAQIEYMLSLSSQELNDYLIQDAEEKRNKADADNFMLVFKYLANQEADQKNDQSIFQKRMTDIQKGLNPYTEEEFEDATSKLLIDSSLGMNTQKENYINAIQYIDSTLIRQLLVAEKKDNQNS